MMAAGDIALPVRDRKPLTALLVAGLISRSGNQTLYVLVALSLVVNPGVRDLDHLPDQPELVREMEPKS